MLFRSTVFSPSADYNMTAERGRIAIWKRGGTYLLDRPITGVGFRNFVVAESTLSPAAQRGDARGMVAHNSIVEVFVETGLVGGALYLMMLGSALTHMWRHRRRLDRPLRIRNPQARLSTEFLLISVIAFVIGGFFLALGYTPIFFALLEIGRAHV